MPQNRKKGKKNGKGQNGNGQGKKGQQQKQTSRSNATNVLATGVGASVPKAFGSKSGAGLQCWDAKHPSHLALPRSVGPYTTIRATRRVAVTTEANIIGTFQSNTGILGQGDWIEDIMVSDVNAANPINGTNNARSTTIDLGGLGDAATLVPSALTVQIMCPTALQSASGIVYAGVMNTQAAIAGRTDTWEEYMDKFVQFQNPRLLAASKLALRGVQISSYPLNMAEVSKFSPLAKTTDATFTYASGSPEPVGWAPIAKAGVVDHR